MKKIVLARIAAAAMMFAFSEPLAAQNIPNPVLPNVADAGVMKYNGKYYIGGVRTDGAFYVSDDLVTWEGPFKVITMDNEWIKGGAFGDNQIHANDMQYINGTFHMYWSVNYWGRDKHAVHITRAVADDPLGPYRESVTDTWLDNRIDAHLFRDDDGSLYFYMVRFTDGNTVWVRTMKDPATFSGDPVYQYSSLPDTWERMDNRVLEGPWVIKYRDRYYMMYNANHTGTDWGNYQLGVAEADHPTAFNHGGKYPYPLLGSNQTPLEEEYFDLLSGADLWRMFAYSFDAPAAGWNAPSFDDSGWDRGRGGFASREVEGSTVRRKGTEWTSEKIFLRNKFTVSKKDTGNLALRLTHDGDTKVYLNGNLIYEKSGADYRIVNLDRKAAGYLRDGENVLAAESAEGRSFRGGGRNNFIDVALFDIKTAHADDILYTPGQPNILRGPNGFEWWLIYMADRNREPRSQYVNRIHFFGKTMYADGVTSTATEGYFPVPSAPTYGDRFDSADGWNGSWAAAEGWSVGGGELKAPAASQALLKPAYAATEYLFEAGVKTGGDAGVVVAYADEGNWTRTGIRKAGNAWYMQRSVDGVVSEEAYALPDDFRFGVYHTIKVLRDGGSRQIFIDNIPAPGKSRFVAGDMIPAVPGLYTVRGEASFDGIIYTRGWDEHDAYISGWRSVAGCDAASHEGLVPNSAGAFTAFKGDGLEKYEFSVQVTNDSGAGTAGFYPVYIDERNYLRAVVDYDAGVLVVTGQNKGKVIKEQRYTLAAMKTVYYDVKYTDNMEKGYTLSSPSVVDAVLLPRTDAFHPERVVDNMFDKVGFEYLSGDGKWCKPSGVSIADDANPAYTRMSFDPVETARLRFTNTEPTDGNHWIYKIRINVVKKESYNLRAVKLGGVVKIFVDGKEAAEVSAAFGPSQVGLCSDGCTPAFNGILRYDTPQR